MITRNYDAPRVTIPLDPRDPGPDWVYATDAFPNLRDSHDFPTHFVGDDGTRWLLGRTDDGELVYTGKNR